MTETPLQRLGYTAGGAAATAFVGGYLAKKGYGLKTVASALAALGAGLTWKGETEPTQSVGSGVLGASTGQLVLELFLDYENKRAVAREQPTNDTPPPGALEAAMNRAHARLAVDQRK